MKPTLRDKYRYIVVKIRSKTKLSKEDAEKIIQKEIAILIGTIHFSKVMPKIAFFDASNQMMIIRCLNEGTDDLKTALALIRDHGEKPIHLMSVYTSGTIRKAKEAMKKITI